MAGPSTGMLTPSSRLDSSGVATQAASAPAACHRMAGLAGGSANWEQAAHAHALQSNAGRSSSTACSPASSRRLERAADAPTCRHYHIQRHIRPGKVADHRGGAAARAAADQQQACSVVASHDGTGVGCNAGGAPSVQACRRGPRWQAAPAEARSPTAYSGGRPSSCTNRSASEGSTAYCRARPSSTQPGERSTRLTS